MEAVSDGAFEYERPYNKKRMEDLKKKIEEGKAILFNWSCAYVVSDDELYRVNGQHSSHAILNIDKFPRGLKAVITEYACDTKDDLADLFAQFDPRSSSRTPADNIRAAQAARPKLQCLKPTIVNTIATGILIAGRNGKETRFSQADQKVAVVRDNEGFIEFFADIYTGGDKIADAKHLYKAAVAAVMYKTWCKDKVAADEFWTDVRDGVELKKSDPAYVACNYLLTANLSRIGGSGKKVTAFEIYCRLIRAWNAFRKGDKITRLLRVREEDEAPKIA